MAAAKKAIAIFLRYPEAGKVKTRLASGIGNAEALRIYCKLLRRTLGVASDFKASRADVAIILFFTPAEKRAQVAELLPGPWQFAAQQGTHLGERMHRAIEQTLAAGYQHVSLVGSDAADLQTTDFADAFQSLREGCAFLGPAADGGFYLMGLNRPCPSAFASDQWGGPEVFQRTRSLLQSAGFNMRVGQQRKDIDRPEDVGFFSAQTFMRETLSVVVPTRKPIEQLSPLLKLLETGLWPGDEIIVSSSARHSLGDHERMARKPPHIRSNSSQPSFLQKSACGICNEPRTVAVNGAGIEGIFSLPSAAGNRVRMVHSPQGRGAQMNRGADEASGDLYWFLHDDSIPPGQFAYHIRKLSVHPEKSLGCFLLDFFPANRTLDLIAHWANFRTVYFGRPYGDQGLFCGAETFHRLGGFHKSFLMEDVDFVGRAKRIGELLVIREKLLTSSARYLNRGVLRACLHNHLTMLRHLAGVEDRKLYLLYYGIDKSFF